jgi:hypothetical protein
MDLSLPCRALPRVRRNDLSLNCRGLPVVGFNGLLGGDDGAPHKPANSIKT